MLAKVGINAKIENVEWAQWLSGPSRATSTSPSSTTSSRWTMCSTPTPTTTGATTVRPSALVASWPRPPRRRRKRLKLRRHPAPAGQRRGQRLHLQPGPGGGVKQGAQGLWASSPIFANDMAAWFAGAPPSSEACYAPRRALSRRGLLAATARSELAACGACCAATRDKGRADWKLETRDITDRSAHWDAHYRFSATGRLVRQPHRRRVRVRPARPDPAPPRPLRLLGLVAPGAGHAGADPGLDADVPQQVQRQAAENLRAFWTRV
jgi:hypothetical protein